MDYKIKVGGGDPAEPLNVAKRLALISQLNLNNKRILDCGCCAGEYIPGLEKFKNARVWALLRNAIAFGKIPLARIPFL